MTTLTGTPTILIVDDTPSNLSVVVNLFEDRGYRVAIAQDGEEGMQRAQLVQPDLILLDVMMPGIDGFEACRRLKQQPGTRDIPVIFMTALASAEHKVKGFQAGAIDYVTKPLQIDEVMARVDTHLKLHAAQKRLEEQNLQLEQHSEELERRVEERTAELAAREREFRTLAENAPDNIVRYDRQCRYVYGNPQHEKTVGIPMCDLIGKMPVECFPGTAEVVAYQARIRAVIETGRPAEDEAITPGEGGRLGYHHIRLLPERDEDGEITGVLAIGNDITERKRAERELHLLNRALDHSFDATYLLDADLHFRYVNEAAVRELGYSREELLSMSLLDVDPDVTREMVMGLMEQTASAGRFPGIVESRHKRKNGDIFPIEVGAATFDYDGERLFLTAVRNITERREAERLLHEREQAICAVVEHSPDAVARYDAQFRRIYVNPATQKLLGLPLDQILGKTPEELPLLPPKDFSSLLKSVFESGQERQIELPFHKANGESGWGHMRVVPEFGPDGEVATVLSIGRDITERKLAEEALAAREREFRTLAENIPDTIIRYDSQGRKTYVNTAVASFIGVAADTLIGRTPQETLPARKADQADAYVANLWRTLDSGEPQESEVSLHHAQHGERILNIKFVAERNESGGIVGALMVGRDVTERKRAEEELIKHRERLEDIVQERTAALQESEARLRALIDNLPFEFWAMDDSLRYIMQNAASLKNYGGVVGKRIEDLGLPPEVAAQWVEQDKKVLAGETLYGEYEKDVEGESKAYDNLIAPVLLGDAVIGIVGVSMDVTARKRAEEQIRRLNEELEQRVRERTMQLESMNEELRESEQRYHEIFDNAVEGIYLLEVTEDGRFRNVDINLAMATSTGIPREAMIGYFVDETVPEDVARVVIEKYRRCVDAGKTIQEEVMLDLPAGKRYYYSTVTPIFCGGRVHRLIGISRDITELKRVEFELEESREQLRGLTASREEAREEERKYIAREVHDELGQILTGLKLNVSFLDHKFSAGSQELREHLKETLLLTDRSLEVARNVASALRPAVLDMGIASALEWLAGRFSRNTGIECEVFMADKDIQLSEKCAIALFRIVQESLTNVSRHAQANRITISLSAESGDYVLKVRDNGKGFDVTRKKMDSFGLVGIRERAIMLGGTVAIDSHPGKGTEIEVRIPSQKISEEL